MKCAQCGHENRSGAKFCEECAAALMRECPNCGAPLSLTANFCSQCDHPRSPGLQPAPQLHRLRAPEIYTPKYLAEKILTSRAAVEGERKVVTVLFADLQRSMELLANRDPEQARKILDSVLGRMMDAVHRYEGTVNQVMGDGIMALFGAPLAHEDHAVRACYAALSMKDSVRRYADELRRTEGKDLRIRVGLNSGEVVVRSIGSDLRMDYSAIGQTTHVAARMEQLAAPDSIRLTASTLRLAEGFVQAASLGPIPVKGLAEPVEAFELAGAGGARTRLEVVARRGLTRFVGRTTELNQLLSALELAGRGQAQVVAVVGEPGVGKSRLFWELIHSRHVHGWRIVQSASVSYGTAAAYLPVIELLRSYFGIESGEEPQKIREEVTARVLALDLALAPIVPALLALLDVAVNEPPSQALDLLQRRQQMFDAVKLLLTRESKVQPLVVVFEDLHWIDSETHNFLQSLIDGLPAARLVLLVNYRPEYQHAWSTKTYYRELRIDALSPENADKLLDALLGPDSTLGPLKRLLVDRTDANPLFLEESVQALVETSALVGQRGAYRLTGAVDHHAIPGTVQAILATRIDRLASDTKRLLQAAAVIGKIVPMSLLLAIADAPEVEVRAALTHLQAAEFLYETQLFPEVEYTFKHALTHEVAYTGLLHERRRTLHARITGAIERLSPEQVEELAHHSLRGELWEKAVDYLYQSGLRAIRRSACREAIVHLEQALATLPHRAETRQTTELNIDIRLALRNALMPLSKWGRMGEHLHEAEALARRLGDERRLGYIAAFRVVQYRIAGQYDESVRCGQEALGIARTLGDRSIEVLATHFLGITYVTKGEFIDAVTLLASNIALESELNSRPYLADALSLLGRFDEAIGHAETAVQIAEAVDHPFTLLQALLNLGVVQLRRGNLRRAIKILERCSDLSRTSQLGASAAFVAASLGAAYALAGRPDEALPLVGAAFEEFRRHRGQLRPPAPILLWAGMIHLAAGHVDEAADHVRETLALTRRTGARPIEAEALCLSGDVALAGGGKDAERSYREALALADALGMRPLGAHCHLGLGKLYAQMAQLEDAREHLAAATGMYREMDMRPWLEQATLAMYAPGGEVRPHVTRRPPTTR